MKFLWLFILVLFSYGAAKKCFVKQQITKISEQVPLDWSDYKGSPSGSVGLTAYTSYGIHYQHSAAEKKIDHYAFRIIAGFLLERNKSWKDSEVLVNASRGRQQILLDHERGHLAIGWIAYQDFLRSLEKYRFTKNFKKEIDSIYKKYYMHQRIKNREYDMKTKHGLVTENQKLWNENLSKDLVHYPRVALSILDTLTKKVYLTQEPHK